MVRLKRYIAMGFILILFIMSSWSDMPSLGADKAYAEPITESMEGLGTAEEPYIIMTPEQLDQVRNDLEAHYELGANIDMSGYVGFHPIGYIYYELIEGGVIRRPNSHLRAFSMVSII